MIVISASAGGFSALQTFVSELPADFPASVFIVWHMASDMQGVLPNALNRVSQIYSANAYEGEKIVPNRVYVAPPDKHLIIGEGLTSCHARAEGEPLPSGHRPAFSVAAQQYGNRVIGVILSGALDDGVAGLWTIKHQGGIAVVQNPAEAEVPGMPQNALEQVAVDHVVSIHDLAPLLTKLINEPLPEKQNALDEQQLQKEIDIARGSNAFSTGLFEMGQLSPFTCPECQGVLAKYMDGKLARYRCHTGHAYSVDTLLAAITERVEDGLYSAIRGIDESVLLLNHMGDHLAEINQPKLAAKYFQKAVQAGQQGDTLRKVVAQHERLTKEAIGKGK